MDHIVSEFYQENLQTKSSSQVHFQYNTRNFIIYEVIRTTEGVLLFLEDHFERMKISITGIGLEKKFCESDIRNYLEKLLLTNRFQAGNIKLLCKVFKNDLFYSAYYIPYEYPSEQMYREGVKLTTYVIERPDPTIKQVLISERIRKTIENTKIQTSVYEILLVDHDGCITEGSKSNIFLVHDNKLYSPPEDKILHGITRRHVLQIAGSKKIKIIVRPIKLSEITQYESAFICGTSSKILPVKRINNNNLKIRNRTIDLIRIEYDNDIQRYINETQFSRIK